MIATLKAYFARRRQAREEFDFVRGYAWAAGILGRDKCDDDTLLVQAYGKLVVDSPFAWTRGVQVALSNYRKGNCCGHGALHPHGDAQAPSRR